MLEREIAKALEQGYNCAQIVFGFLAKELELEPEIAKKIAAGFGVGMLRGETCGAVTGAIMAIGLCYGNNGEDNQEIQEKRLQEKIIAYQSEMERIYGSLICKEMLRFDPSIPEELKRIEENKLFHTFCPKVIEDSINIIRSILSR